MHLNGSISGTLKQRDSWTPAHVPRLFRSLTASARKHGSVPSSRQVRREPEQMCTQRRRVAPRRNPPPCTTKHQTVASPAPSNARASKLCSPTAQRSVRWLRGCPAFRWQPERTGNGKRGDSTRCHATPSPSCSRCRGDAGTAVPQGTTTRMAVSTRGVGHRGTRSPNWTRLLRRIARQTSPCLTLRALLGTTRRLAPLSPLHLSDMRATGRNQAPVEACRELP